MVTGVQGVVPRQDPRQVVNTLRKTVNYNDVGIGSGLAMENWLPQGAFLMRCLVEIVTAFNAGTTNVLTVGTNAAAYDNIVAAGDVDEAVVDVYDVTRAVGRGLASAGNVRPYVMYTQSGTAATAGQAVILLSFDGGWAT